MYRRESRFDFLPFIFRTDESSIDIMRKTKVVIRSSEKYSVFMKTFNNYINNNRNKYNYTLPNRETEFSKYTEQNEETNLNTVSYFSNKKKKKIEKLTYNNPINIFNAHLDLFDNFSNININIVYDTEYIYQKEKYKSFIKQKIKDIKTNKNENYTTNLKKKFSKISLNLLSLQVEFINITDPISNNITFNLPLSLLPIFYYVDLETFKIILAAIITFDRDFKNISINDEMLYPLLNNLDQFKDHDFEFSKYKIHKFHWITPKYMFDVFIK